MLWVTDSENGNKVAVSADKVILVFTVPKNTPNEGKTVIVLTAGQILGMGQIPSIFSKSAVPINISTSSIDTNYRQMGMLTPLNGSSKDNILPLMGRPLQQLQPHYQAQMCR